MSLLQKVLSAHRCTSTHQKLILDALCHLRINDAEKWQRLFLKHGEPLLQGAIAPDATFKDFRNHVLHVREKCWGGALESAETWYKNTVQSLKAKQWSKAAYAAGVLSHYYTDPLMPLQTGQTEEAAIIRSACERSVFRTYDLLMAILERDLGGYPDVKVPAGPRWLAEMVKTGARLSHEHYDVLVDHYDLSKGRRKPAAGLDDEIRVSMAECLGHAVIGCARLLDRAIADAEVAAPRAWIGVAGLRAWSRIPAMRWARYRANARSRRTVNAIFKEVRKTGKAMHSLPEGEQIVRRLHAQEVLKTTQETLDALKPRAIGTKHGTGTYLRPMAAARACPPAAHPPKQSDAAARDPRATNNASASPTRSTGSSDRPRQTEPAATARAGKPIPRLAKFHLDQTSSLADAPSIGARTAEKLAAIGIRIVAQFLEKKPEEIALRLKLGHIKPEIVREWQVQARLACRVPNLRALDVKLLVACGICEPEALASCEPLDLLDRVDLFVSTSEGQRAIRGGSQPDLDTVRGWIQSAQHARTLKAA